MNLSNGGLNINIPLGTIGGRGNVALPLSLSYSSKIWSATMDVDTERTSGSEQSVAFADYDMGSSLGGGPVTPGWTLNTGMYLTFNLVRIKKITSGPNSGCYSYGLSKLSLHLPDKGEIEFRDDATDGAPLPLNCANQQTASRGTRWHATDGSGAIFLNDGSRQSWSYSRLTHNDSGLPGNATLLQGKDWPHEPELPQRYQSNTASD